MYPVLKAVLAEFSSIFADEYIHLGNDEVYYDCWYFYIFYLIYYAWNTSNFFLQIERKSNPELAEWMRSMNFGNEYSHLQAYYSSKLLKTVAELNKKSIVWEGKIYIMSFIYEFVC